VLAPLSDGAPSVIALYGSPGAAGFDDTVPGLVALSPGLPGSICNLNRLGAEGSSRFRSAGEEMTLLGVSDDPSESWGAGVNAGAELVVVASDGVPAVPVDVAGFVVSAGG
jgi:hypothetical protein